MVTLKDLMASEEELSKKPLLQRLSARLKQGVASGAARAGKRLLPDAVVDLLHYFTILFNGRAHNLTYYGAPVRIDGEVMGSLCFSWLGDDPLDDTRLARLDREAVRVSEALERHVRERRA